MATSPNPVAPKQPSFLEKLESAIYLSYVLRALGVIFLVIALLTGWHSLPWYSKGLMIVAPIMWFVGARFDKVYR